MNCAQEISIRVEKIKTIFQKSKEEVSIQKNLELLIQHLEQIPSEFRSFAYEGASMGIALNDITKNKSLDEWNLFLEKSKAHSAQIHAGLGWAIAKQNISVTPILEKLSPLERFRVLDGQGYYDGIFKQRISFRDQITPIGFNKNMLQAYYQGIGRSLWYTNNCSVNKIQEIILSFPLEHRAALWVGIGVACAYVGGADENLLKSISIASESYQKQLAIGATLAARSRIQANSLTDDVELACKIWCNSSAQQSMLLSVKSEPSASAKAEDR